MDNGRATHVAGGSQGRTFLGVDQTWTRNDATVSGPGVDPDHEDFADMFLGWAHNLFEPNAAGTARSAWMTTNMAQWVH